MLGGCKEKAKYDESAFQDDLEPLTDDELEAMDENSDDEMTVDDEAELEQPQQRKILQRKTDAAKYRSADCRESRNWMKKGHIRIKMKLPSIFMSMAMRRPI